MIRFLFAPWMLFFFLVCGPAPSQLSAQSDYLVPFASSPQTLLDAAELAEKELGYRSDIIILQKDVEYSWDADGRESWRRHLIYQVVTNEGMEGWSAVGAEWSPWHQATPEVRARVVTPDGRSHEFDTTTLVDSATQEVSPEIYDDRRMIQGPLPALKLGAVVEEEVVIRDTEPFFRAGTTGTAYFVDVAPIRRGRLSLSAPTTLPLRFGARLTDLQPQREVRDGRVFVNYEYRDAARVEEVENGLPPQKPRFPSVAFSTGRDWNAIATSYSKIVEERLEGAELDDLLPPREAGESDFDRIDKILAVLQQKVRYTGLELGAASIIPVTPAETLKRQFGDCKDQATLLIGMLRAAGIPAYVALLNAGYDADVEARLPGLGGFNHAIVYVPGSRPIWIDPTSPYSRAGELPEPDEGRWALIAAPSSERLVRTPNSNSVDNRVVEHREIFMADFGSGRVIEKSEFHGHFEYRQRGWSLGETEDRRDGYREYVQSEYLADDLGALEESTPEDLTEPFRLSLEALDAGRVATDLEEAAVGIPLNGLFSDLPTDFFYDELPKRKEDFVYSMPFVVEWKYKIHPPEGMELREMPESEKRDYGVTQLERNFEMRDGVLYVDLRFNSGPRRLTAEQFDETREALADLVDEQILLLQFDHAGAAHLIEGRSREAIEEYRRWTLGGEAASKPVHHIRLSQALLSVGMQSAALAAAQKAVDLDPDMALAWWALGFTRMHDAFGRVRGTGYDHDGAVKALARGADLDPDNSLIRAELGILLDFNEDGVRWGPGADLDRAIEAYRSWRTDFESDNLNENLINTMARAQRWEELDAFLGELDDSASKTGWRLVASAGKDGPDAAIKLAQRLSRGMERDDKIEIFSSAAQQMMLARLYKGAAGLMRLASADSPNPAATMRYADLIGSAPSLDDPISEDLDPARKMFYRFVRIMASEEDEAASKWLEMMHPSTFYEKPDEDELRDLHRAMQAMMGATTGELPIKTALELAMAAFEPKVEGDLKRGMKVAFSSVGGAGPEARLYIEEYEGRTRLLSFQGQQTPLARRALDRLADGDVEAARQWLEWARDDLSGNTANPSDPFVGNPFVGLWDHRSDHDAASLRRAAVALWAIGDAGERVLPDLETALGESIDEVERRWLEIARIRAFTEAELWPKISESAAVLLEQEPDSESMFRRLSGALRVQERIEEARELAHERLRSKPGDLTALDAIVRIHLQEGKTEEAIQGLRHLVDEYDSSDAFLQQTSLNQLAWTMLFKDSQAATLEESLEVAQKGAEETSYSSYPVLHTLASAYAELDRPLEAYRVTLQALELKDPVPPDAPDWYVLGRIAETYGLSQSARDYYQLLEKPESPEWSSWELVQKRLQQMAPEPKPKKKKGKRRG